MHLFLSIFLSTIIFHLQSLDHELARLPHAFFPYGITQQAHSNKQKAKPQHNRNSRHFFWHVSFYIHPYTNTAQSQLQLQNCNHNPVFYTQLPSFFLPINTAISVYVSFIFYGKRLFFSTYHLNPSIYFISPLPTLSFFDVFLYTLFFFS